MFWHEMGSSGLAKTILQRLSTENVWTGMNFASSTSQLKTELDGKGML